MFCPKCGKEVAFGSTFCPYCAESIPVQVTAPQPPVYGAPYVGTPYQPEGMPGVNAYELQNGVSSTQTLGIVSIIAAFFVPLASFICGGIGLSKVKKLLPFAPAQQQEQLKKNKKLCNAGIIIASVLLALSIILSVVWGVYIGKKVYDEYSYYDNGSYSEEEIEQKVDEYIEEYVNDMFDD